MAKYIDICRQIDRARRYMSNAIGMCQRELRVVIQGEKSRADIFLIESETYRAFSRNEDLSVRFDASRAIPGYLIWTHDLKTGAKHPPFPVSVDLTAGIVRQEDAKVFGILSDVLHCLFVKGSDGKLRKWTEVSDPQKPVAHSTSEILQSSALTSSASSMASNRRRIGQDWFRLEVIKLWDGKCAITKCTALSVLRASHIARWADSSTADQLDGFNGILLAAHLDAAFEVGLISFDDSGRMLYSSKFSSSDRRSLGLKGDERLPRVFPQSLKYLKIHRVRHGFDA